jgi:hypothetical protein
MPRKEFEKMVARYQKQIDRALKNANQPGPMGHSLLLAVNTRDLHAIIQNMRWFETEVEAYANEVERLEDEVINGAKYAE